MSKIKILYIFTHCTKSGPIQQMLNLIKNLDRSKCEPCLITVYEETTTEISLLEEYKKILPCMLVKTSKIDMMLGRVSRIKAHINDFQPDIIHTFGVFPDYMIAKMGFENHVLTSRNYVYDDYPDVYGKVLGYCLAKIHLYAIKHTKFAHCCSKSLHDIYLSKLNMNIPYIRNGVDLSVYKGANDLEKIKLRKEFSLPEDKKIVIYGGVFNERKNQKFLLEGIEGEKQFDDICFLLLGDGVEYEALYEMYSKYSNIIMPGNTNRMSDYLRASDYYISTSKSEGLPNGVLEAMATGLPVLLSDIPQHKEIIDADNRVGQLYLSGNVSDFRVKIKELVMMDYHKTSAAAVESAIKNFSANTMSKNYQDLYQKIYCKGEFNG